MILRDLLAELRQNILRDVSTIVTGLAQADFLWTDEALIRYIRDAEEKFAAQTLCLRDSKTAAVANITLVAGQNEYDLDPRVISVYNARYGSTIRLGRSSFATLFGAKGDITPNAAYYEPNSTGQPRLYYTDGDTGSIGFYPTPTTAEAGQVIRLWTARRPLVPLSKNNLDAEPEIPGEYHLDLLEWAAWRALRNHDADIDGDPNNIAIVMARANSHRNRFNEAVLECKREIKYLQTQHVEFGVNTNWSC